MSNGIKVAFVIAGAALIGLAAWIYFSPYQTCVRARTEALKGMNTQPENSAKITCTEIVSGIAQ